MAIFGSDSEDKVFPMLDTSDSKVLKAEYNNSEYLYIWWDYMIFSETFLTYTIISITMEVEAFITVTSVHEIMNVWSQGFPT